METQAFREYFETLKKTKKTVNGKYFTSEVMSYRFPDMEKFVSSQSNRMNAIYDILHYVTGKPKCKHCGKEVELKSFTKGYRQFCSNQCVNDFNANSEEFSQKMSQTMRKKFDTVYYNEKYEFVKEKKGEDFLISGYCEHGEFWLNKNKFKRYRENGIEMCEKCLERNLQSLNTATLEEAKKLLEETSLNVLREDRVKSLHPAVYAAIEQNSIDKMLTFREKKYLFFHQACEIPFCPVCKKNRVKIQGNFHGFSKTCTSYACMKSS